jgi:hypothetical protein
VSGESITLAVGTKVFQLQQPKTFSPQHLEFLPLITASKVHIPNTMEDKGESTVPVPVADEAPAVVPDAPTTTSPDPASNPPAEQSQPQPMEEDNESDWEDLDG